MLGEQRKPEDMVSNADSGYEIGSIVSALSSAQITKVRHTLVE